MPIQCFSSIQLTSSIITEVFSVLAWNIKLSHNENYQYKYILIICTFTVIHMYILVVWSAVGSITLIVCLKEQGMKLLKRKTMMLSLYCLVQSSFFFPSSNYRCTTAAFWIGLFTCTGADHTSKLTEWRCLSGVLKCYFCQNAVSVRMLSKGPDVAAYS